MSVQQKSKVRGVHRTHISAKEYRHRAKGTQKQIKRLARKLGVPCL